MESAEVILDRYQRHTIAVRHTLLGKGWFTALEAMEFALGFHKGTRKDKITPEFYHQIEIAGYLLTLSSGLMFPEETIAVSFLHDCPEDYDVGFKELDSRFSTRISRATELVTKTHRGRKIDPEVYFLDMEDDPISSVVKGSDRIHNQSTIVPVFSRDKQDGYLEETTNRILPMLKSARKKHPRQYDVYRNIMFVLRSQVDLIRAVHTAQDAAKEKHE
jgi:(p)ppGpp synthase/HD superfamily hydrolase